MIKGLTLAAACLLSTQAIAADDCDKFSSIEDRLHCLQQASAALSKRADDLEAALVSATAELAKTKAALNEQFRKLATWGTDLGDKYNDATLKGEWGYNTGDPNHGGSCEAGAVLTGIQMGAPYKLRYRCRRLPALTIN